jgi:PST family polysaccharide transporter
VIDFFEDAQARAGHQQAALRGGLSSVVSRAFSAMVQVCSVVVLARLLTPEDYGLVAMVLAITSVTPMIVDLGTREAVGQQARITQGEVSALFWITITAGLLFALLIVLISPSIARLYGEPRLIEIAWVSSLTVLASALTCQHYGLLRRAMMFRQVALVEAGANFVGACAAVGMALLGTGYWALVMRPLVTALCVVGGVFWYCPWIPRKPTITSGVKEMLRFGANMMGFTVADFVGRNADSVAIGLTAGAQRLGFYRKALLIYDNLLDLTVALHAVAAVSLSKLRDDHVELRRLWAKGLRTLSFYAMPAFGIVAVIGNDLIYLVLGERWSFAGILLTLLALRGIPHVVERTLGWLHVAAGRSDRWARWGLLQASVQIIALLIGLPFGPIGVIVAYTLAMYLMFVPTLVYAGRPLGVQALDVARAIWQPMIGTLVAVGVGLVLAFVIWPDMSRLLRLSLSGVSFVVVYLAVVPGVMRLREPLLIVVKLWGTTRREQLES